MKYASILTLLIGLPFLFILEAHSQIVPNWQSLGPGRAEVRSLNISSSGLIFTTSESGVHVSPDAGVNWDRFLYIGNGMYQSALSSREIMYFVSYKRPDSSSEFTRQGTYSILIWQVLSEDPSVGVTSFAGFRRLEFPAIGEVTNIPTASDGAGYVGIGHTIWYYIGWGYGFSKHQLPVDTIHQLAWDGLGEAYAATSEGIYAFEEPWKELEPRFVGPDSIGFRSVIQLSDGTLAAGADNGSLYLRGSSLLWNEIPIDSTGLRAIEETQQGAWLVGSASGIFRSDDAGGSWTLTSLARPIRSIHQHPLVEALFAVAMDGGLYISQDDGVNWTFASWTESDIEYLHAAPNGVALGRRGTVKFVKWITEV